MSFPRYPKYKDSGVEWLGEVPEHWGVQRLKHMAARIPYAIVDGPFGTQLKAEDYRSSGVPLVRISNLSFTGKFLEDDLVFIEDSKAEEVSRSNVRRGDVVIGKTGATIGKSALFNYSDKGVIASSCLKITPDTDAVSSAFLGRIIESDGFQKTLLNESGGSTRDTINITPFGNLSAVLPPMAEQLRICRFLDRETAKIDALIAEQQRLIELLQEKRQAVISHAVTKGLNPDVPMKDSGVKWLGEVPEHWRLMAVRRLLARIEQGWSPECFSRPAENEEWGVVKTGCVNRGTFADGENKALPDTLAPVPEYEICVGDLLMSRASGSPELVGSTAYVHDTRPRLMLSDKIFRLRPNPDVDRRYLALIFNAPLMRFQIERAISGAEGLANNLPQSALKGFVCPLPPSDEQEAIVEYVSRRLAEFDLLSTEARGAIALLHERRSALISAAVTGQIDVRGLAGSEAA